MGAEIGTSPGAGRAAALEMGDVSAGSTPAGGVVKPGVVAPGACPVGLVRAGFVRAGFVSAGSVRAGPVAVADGRLAPGAVRPGVVSPGVFRPGVVRPGAVSPGAVSPGVVRPGAVRPGVVSPGDVRVAGVDEPEPVSRLVGIGGRLIPNCERPCDSADISSLGRSVTIAAWTNWRCCVGGSVLSDSTDPATTAAGLATARAATALMAVESLRRRRFGTELSSIHGLHLVGALASWPRGNEIDGTGVTTETKVAIRNCEPIAT